MWTNAWPSRFVLLMALGNIILFLYNVTEMKSNNDFKHGRTTLLSNGENMNEVDPGIGGAIHGRRDDKDLRTENINRQAKYALVFFGGVSRMYHSMHAREIYDNSEPVRYTPINITANSLSKHIVEVNGGAENFDLYIHSWNRDLKDEYMQVFHKKREGMELMWSLFEDNLAYEEVYKPLLPKNAYRDNWRMMSFSVSLSKSAMAVIQAIKSNRNNTFYERVLFIRPDIVLIEDMDFGSSVYKPQSNVVHVDRHPGGNGDFYFLVSSSQGLEQMARLSLDVFRDEAKNDIEIHGFIQRAFNKHNITFKIDRILPGVHVEVYRKLCHAGLMKDRGSKFYSKYGIRKEDWLQMLELCGVQPGNPHYVE